MALIIERYKKTVIAYCSLFPCIAEAEYLMLQSDFSTQATLHYVAKPAPYDTSLTQGIAAAVRLLEPSSL